MLSPKSHYLSGLEFCLSEEENGKIAVCSEEIIDILSSISYESMGWSRKKRNGDELREKGNKEHYTCRTWYEYNNDLGNMPDDLIAQSLANSTHRLVGIDLGCGSGVVVNHLNSNNSRTITAYGITDRLWEENCPRSSIIVGDVSGNGGKVPYVMNMIPTNSIDFALSERLYMWLPNDTRANFISQVYRIIKPGGFAIIDTRKRDTDDIDMVHLIDQMEGITPYKVTRRGPSWIVMRK